MHALKFGVVIPQGWRGEISADLPGPKQYELIAKAAERAEDLGFTSGWLFDHLHKYPSMPAAPNYECWTLLSALSSETKRLRLGQIVTCNLFRYPSVLAKMASSLDVISNGRLEFGLGACWDEEEHSAYGIPFPKPAIRLGMLDEAIQIIKLMWTEDRPSFRGKYYSIEEAVNRPKPIQKPHPPVMIGGGGPKITLRIVAKHANMCNLGAYRTAEEYEKGFQLLREHCEKIGRDFSEIEATALRELIIGETEAEVQEKLAKIPQVDMSREREQRYTQNRVVGTPEQCAESIRALKDLGVTYFIFYMRDALQPGVLELVKDKLVRLIAAN